MTNFLPEFICRNYKNGIYSGSFQGTSLYIDISGFTAMTEILMQKGIEGAEVLSGIIKRTFVPMGDIIEANKGFITQFAGDSFFAVFMEEQHYISACRASLSLMDFLEKNKIQSTRLGSTDITGKIGLASANFLWVITKSKELKNYYFKGQALERSIQCIKSALPGMINIDNNLRNMLGKKAVTKKVNKDFYELKDITLADSPSLKAISADCTNEIYGHFIDREFLQESLTGEFRDVASIFLGFEELTDDMIDKAKNTANAYGRHKFSIIFSDKGNTILILFGVPISYENNAVRAVSLVHSLRKKLECRFRAGITFGRVYAGMIGNRQLSCYDVLGSAINLASRLMEYSDWGMTWISSSVYNRIKDSFDTDFLGNKKFKGFAKRTPVYRLSGKKKAGRELVFDSDMVGRTEEMAKLISFCRPIFNGKSPGVLYIYGNAGIGKSRLAHEAINNLKDRADIFILQIDNIIKKGLNPFEYALKEHFGQNIEKGITNKRSAFDNKYDKLMNELQNQSNDQGKGEILSELNRTRSILAALAGIRWENSLYEFLDAKSRYYNTLYAIKVFFKASSLIRPVILLVDDLHWIDDASREALKILSANIYDFPIAFIIASRYRDDGSKHQLDLNREIKIDEIELEDLDPYSVREFIKNHLGYEADDGLLKSIKERTSGNPFYIEQFCYYLKENNLFELKNGLAGLKSSSPDIPSGIAQVIISRIDRLSADLKNAVQIASVLGREFETRILMQLLSLYNNRANPKNINELIEAGEKEQIWAPVSEIMYIFRHTLLYETVYSMQLKSQLRKLHNMAAEALIIAYSQEEGRLPEIAYHYYESQDIEKAFEYHQKAGKYLAKIYDNQKALEVYTRMLSLVQDPLKQLSILLNIAEIRTLTGDWVQALEDLDRALILSREVNDEYYQCKIKHYLSKIYNNMGEYITSINTIKYLIEILPKYTQIRYRKLLCGVYSLMAINHHAMSSYDTALKYYSLHREIAEEIGDQDEMAAQSVNTGLLYYEMGLYDKALTCYTHAKEIKEKINDRIGIAGIFTNLGLLYYTSKDYDKSLEYYNRSMEIHKETGNKKELALIVGNMGNVYYSQDKYTEAMECYSYLENICAEIGDKRGLAMAYANYGSIYQDVYKDLETAKYYFEKSIEIFENMGEKIGLSIVTSNIGRLYLEQKNYKLSEHFLKYCLKLCNELNIDSYKLAVYENLTELYISMKENDLALNYIEKALKITKADKQESMRFLALRKKMENKKLSSDS